jgi:hypothetical protein
VNWYRKNEVLRKTLHKCHFMHHKSLTNCPGTECGLSGEKLLFIYLSYGMIMNINNIPENTAKYNISQSKIFSHLTYNSNEPKPIISLLNALHLQFSSV